MLNIGSNINEVRVDGCLKAFQRDLSAFAGFGLTAAEISIHGLDLVINGSLNHRQASAARAIMAKFPFRYSAHAPNPLNLMDRNYRSLHRDVLLASLDFAAEAGVEVLVYHPGRYLAEEEFAVSGPLLLDPAEQQQLMDVEAAMVQEAADRFPTVTIAMENARPFLGHSPYCYAEFPGALTCQVERISRENVRIALDFGHLQMACRHYGLDSHEQVRRMGPYIAHCHVHDSFGNPVNFGEKNQMHQLPFGKGDSHMPVGWGAIPFAELFREFIADYDGMLICELRGRYFEYTGEAAANLSDILAKLDITHQRPLKSP